MYLASYTTADRSTSRREQVKSDGSGEGKQGAGFPAWLLSPSDNRALVPATLEEGASVGTSGRLASQVRNACRHPGQGQVLALTLVNRSCR